jgi:hypothetical protein
MRNYVSSFIAGAKHYLVQQIRGVSMHCKCSDSCHGVVSQSELGATDGRKRVRCAQGPARTQSLLKAATFRNDLKSNVSCPNIIAKPGAPLKPIVFLFGASPFGSF